MQAAIENLTKMMAIWNTTDPAEIERLAEEALEHNVHFADPNHNIVGRKAFVEMVHLVQSQIPGAVYARNSEIDVQNNFCRYHWKIDMGDKRLMNGFDMTEVNDSGKIAKVIGFFGLLERGDA
ncbi:MAG: nuclear transport factor 2 family protein [Erythrobacter sp.]|nr:nuclear transport factor 2 family protein [Erythrobacter sp.]